MASALAAPLAALWRSRHGRIVLVAAPLLLLWVTLHTSTWTSHYDALSQRVQARIPETLLPSWDGLQSWSLWGTLPPADAAMPGPAHVHRWEPLSADELEVGGRPWRGGLHTPHHTLLDQVKTLEPEEYRVYGWLNHSRGHSPASYGTSLGVSRVAAPVRLEARQRRLQQQPLSDEGPGHFFNGSRAKYERLLTEWQEGEQASVCPGSPPWRERYQVIHNEVMTGQRPPRLVQYSCEKRFQECGGLADRIVGISTVFLAALLSDRAFSLRFDTPLPAEVLAASPFIDWAYPLGDAQRHPIYGNTSIPIENLNIYNAGPWETLNMLNEKAKKWRDTDGLAKVIANRGGVVRSFAWGLVAPQVKELGLERDTSFACLMSYLFRPRADAVPFITMYTSFFALPTVFSIGMHIRTGDTSMHSAKADAINTVERHRPFFRCAEQVARRFAKPGQKVIYLLMSDSNTLKADARSRLADRVILTGDSSRHMDKHEHEASERLIGGFSDVEMDASIDLMSGLQVFAQTDVKIITEWSGFGKIGALWGASNTSTIPLVPVNPALEFGPRISKSDVDCGRDDAFAPFWRLAEQWSGA